MALLAELNPPEKMPEKVPLGEFGAGERHLLASHRSVWDAKERTSPLVPGPVGTSKFVVHVPCAPTEPDMTVFCATLTPLVPTFQKPAMRTSTGVIGLLREL